jgi:glycosyl transferase family 87
MMRFAAALGARLSACAWLGRKRVLAYAGTLLAIELAVFLFLVAGTHGLIVPVGQPTTTDFASFYAAGSLVDEGAPAAAYDQAAHRAAEERATEPGIGYQFFFYPPVYLLLCAALARLPYIVAFVTFEAITLVLYVAVARRTLGDPDRMAISPVLAFPSVFWTMGLGQNAFLSAALFGAALLLIDRRPVGSGMLFGLLAYKPHLALLIPIALASGRRWRAFLAAAGTVAVLVAASVLLFGWATWRDYLALVAGSGATYESGRIDFAGFVNLFGGVRLLGGSSQLAYAAQAVITLISAALAIFVWRRNLSLPIRAAALAAAAVAAAPVVLLYDLMLAAIAGAWLIRAARRSGFLAWEKITLATLFILPLFMRNIGTAWHVPLGPLVPLALLALVYARARREIAEPIADAMFDDAAIRDLGRKLAPYLSGA